MRRIRAIPLAAFFAVFCGAAGAESSKPTVDDSRPSPNYTPRSSRKIEYIVIHTVQGSYQGALSWFTRPESRVSAHYTVSKTGRLGQSVADNNIAWHAGNWSYNERSIGIEHEGWVSDRATWTDPMLRKSAALVRHLAAKYGIPLDRKHIVGHVEVPGSDHTDPGPHFPWDRFMDLVKNPDRAAGATEPQPEPQPEPEPEPKPEPEPEPEAIAELDEPDSAEPTAALEEPRAGAEPHLCRPARVTADSLARELVRRKRTLVAGGLLAEAEALLEPIRLARAAEELEPPDAVPGCDPESDLPPDPEDDGKLDPEANQDPAAGPGAG